MGDGEALGGSGILLTGGGMGDFRGSGSSLI